MAHVVLRESHPRAAKYGYFGYVIVACPDTQPDGPDSSAKDVIDRIPAEFFTALDSADSGASKKDGLDPIFESPALVLSERLKPVLSSKSELASKFYFIDGDRVFFVIAGKSPEFRQMEPTELESEEAHAPFTLKSSLQAFEKALAERNESLELNVSSFLSVMDGIFFGGKEIFDVQAKNFEGLSDAEKFLVLSHPKEAACSPDSQDRGLTFSEAVFLGSRFAGALSVKRGYDFVCARAGSFAVSAGFGGAFDYYWAECFPRSYNLHSLLGAAGSAAESAKLVLLGTDEHILQCKAALSGLVSGSKPASSLLKRLSPDAEASNASTVHVHPVTGPVSVAPEATRAGLIPPSLVEDCTRIVRIYAAPPASGKPGDILYDSQEDAKSLAYRWGITPKDTQFISRRFIGAQMTRKGPDFPPQGVEPANVQAMICLVAGALLAADLTYMSPRVSMAIPASATAGLSMKDVAAALSKLAEFARFVAGGISKLPGLKLGHYYSPLALVKGLITNPLQPVYVSSIINKVSAVAIKQSYASPLSGSPEIWLKIKGPNGEDFFSTSAFMYPPLSPFTKFKKIALAASIARHAARATQSISSIKTGGASYRGVVV